MELDVVHCGDCLDILPTLPDASIDAVITDPPYPHIKRDYGYWTEAEWWELIVEGVVPEVRRVLSVLRRCGLRGSADGSVSRSRRREASADASLLHRPAAKSWIDGSMLGWADPGGPGDGPATGRISQGGRQVRSARVVPAQLAGRQPVPRKPVLPCPASRAE